MSIKIIKMGSLVKDPSHPLDPMDASRFYGYVTLDEKRIGSVDHLYRRKEYRFTPDYSFRKKLESDIRSIRTRSLRDLKAKLEAELLK